MKNCILFIFFLALTSCFKQERNCKDYKTGKFEFTYTLDQEVKTGKFVRSDSLSIDYYENKVDSSIVRWINNCEFILTQKNPKSDDERKPIHMKILSTTDEGYTFEYKFAVKDPFKKQKVYRGNAKKID